MRKFFLLSLLSCSLFATEYAPWFSPPWEFQGSATYAYDRQDHIQSPDGSFSSPANIHLLHFSLEATPWPQWNVEAELYFAHTSNIDFAYEAFLITGRYQWLDDIASPVPFSLTTGITLSFPGDRFLHEFSFPYHGNVNAEFHAAIGKEIAHRNFDWFFRTWALAGIGIANRGSSWIHAIAALECKPDRCWQAGFFVDHLSGLGNNNIMEEEAFPGYGSIAHRSVDLALEIKCFLETIGTLSLEGWYNVYARNYPENYFGIALRLMIPFSL